MEEPQSWPPVGGDRSQETAEKLRTLRAQADETLSGHRRRVSDIEAELNLRLQQIAEELARDRVAEETESAAASELQAELAGLQASLTNTDVEVQSLQSQLEKQAREHQARFDSSDEEMGQLIEQAEKSQVERDHLAAQLQQKSDECSRLCQDLESSQHACEELRALECADCGRLREELTALRQEIDDRQTEASRLSDELAAAHQVGEDLRAQECADCARIREEFAELTTQHNECLQQLRALEKHCQELGNTQIDTTRALEESQANHVGATALLEAAERRILESDNDQQHQQQQLEQLKRKFELALADVQKLKRENAELQAELVSRPAASDEESPELVSLRSERDALATRVSELESAPLQAIDEDMQQVVADLQRRFELAVDDVRQLKQVNTKLQEQLASQAVVTDEITITGSDWQSQKARMLAELDAEDQGSVTNERRAARATIEGTIAITDQVVADKDKEITKLQASLEARPAENEMEKIKQAIQEEIFGNDEVIQAERRRLEAIQQEWQEKLSKAELEISVERAKLARNQSAFAEKLADMKDIQLDKGPADDGKPRHRWLSALGLRDDDEEE